MNKLQYKKQMRYMSQQLGSQLNFSLITDEFPYASVKWMKVNDLEELILVSLGFEKTP